MMIRNAPASERWRSRIAKAMRLIRIGSAAINCSASLVLRHRHDGAAGEGPRQEPLQRRQHQQRHQARHQHAQRQVDHADVPTCLDVARLDVAIVDPEHEDQRHLGDEQDAEEEGEAAQRILAVLLERQVVDLVDRGTQQIEGGQREDAGQDRVEAELGAEEIRM